MASFTLRKSIAAPAEIVFDVLSDHRGQADLSALQSSRIEREGEPPPNGVGAIRALRLVGVTIREQVTAFDRPNLFAYKMLSGAPVKAHSATVELAEQGTGTAVTYRVDSIPKLPVPAAAWVAIVRPVIKHLLNGVVKEAERRARVGS
jgi:hypothetical protein